MINQTTVPRELRIIEFRAENFARLKAVVIRPKPGVIKITGKNGEGKSSLLKGIDAALGGRARAPKEAIRRGAKQGWVYVDLGDVVVERIIKKGKHGQEDWSLTVTRADGSHIARTPQAVIDAFYGALSVDPGAFARADDKGQVEMLKRLVKGFDFAANETQRKKLFDRRTDVNRDAKRERAAAAVIVLPLGPRPQPIDVAGKLDELQAANASNAERAQREANRRRASDEIERKREDAEELRARAATLEKDADALQARLDAAGPLPELIDVGALRAELDAAERVKGVIALHDNRETYENAAAALESESEQLTGEIEALDKAKHDAVAAAALPVPGLALGEDAVLLNGLPLRQASGAEMMRVSAAVAMGANPDLKVILVDEGEKLDSQSMALLEEMAKERGFDIWVAKVDESGSCGFVIQDGTVVAEPAP
jgi:DNA repair exonuclease SbcCD ATPase subunit